MRYIALLFILLSSHLNVAAKKFVVLPDGEKLSKSLHYQKYTLNSNQLYGVKHTIELHNFLIPASTDRDESLLLITVLPELTSDNNWQEISKTEMTNNVVNIDEMLDELFVPQFGIVGYPRKFFNDYVAVVESNGVFLAAKNCLVETFTIRDVSKIFPSSMGVLNLQEDELPLREYIKVFKNTFPEDPIPFEIGKKFPDPNYRFGSQLGKEYLSKTFLIDGLKAYQFYTVASDNSADYYHYEKGITRFVFLPGKGIIGGSYDFYFLPPNVTWRERNPSANPNNLTVEQWNNNIFSEKVMLADNF